MSVTTLINKINNLLGDRPHYVAYDMSEVQVMVGLPPLVLKGIQYVTAVHRAPQNKLVMGLGGSGTHVGNFNQSGIIEIGMMATTAHTASIDVLDLTGIPFPITIIDKTTTATAAVYGAKCRRVGTPEWRRTLAPELEIYTFNSDRLAMTGGIRKGDD
jgi:hypothetical protein